MPCFPLYTEWKIPLTPPLTPWHTLHYPFKDNSPPLHPFIIPTQKKYPHPPPIEEKVNVTILPENVSSSSIMLVQYVTLPLTLLLHLFFLYHGVIVVNI